MNQDKSERYERVIQEIVNRMKDEFGPDLLGITLVGSVATGNPMEHSDIDIYVSIKPLWRQRRTFYIDDMEVELFINPVQQTRKEFQDTKQSATFAMFAHGRILYDPQGLMAELAEEAKYAWEQPRPELSLEEKTLLRYHLTDLLKDTQDLIGVDKGAATYHIHATMVYALGAHYKIQRKWTPKPKHLIANLAESFPDLDLAARRVLASCGNLDDRFRFLSGLVERVLEPIGGLIKEWETKKQDLKEFQTDKE